MKYIYRWNRMGRKGQPCNVLARGKMNSCLVEFEDGFKALTSRNALKRAISFDVGPCGSSQVDPSELPVPIRNRKLSIEGNAEAANPDISTPVGEQSKEKT